MYNTANSHRRYGKRHIVLDRFFYQIFLLKSLLARTNSSANYTCKKIKFETGIGNENELV